jgi:cytochrome bd-type quinol oxidase subunit 2
MQIFYLLLSIGVIFGSLAALCAYLITYKEWEHHYSDRKIPRRMALETAIFTLLFFLAIMVVVGLFFK